VLVPDGAAVAATGRALQQMAQQMGCKADPPRTDKGPNCRPVKVYSVRGEAWEFDIDLVAATSVAFESPGVDCDAGNLCITRDGPDLKVKRTPKGTPLVSLATSIEHCQKKQFELYYNPLGGKSAAQRLKKYEKKGWTQLPTQKQWWEC
jgi:hypothetical protein